MANELTLTGAIAYEDSLGSKIDLPTDDDLKASVGTKKFVREQIVATTSEAALNLGPVSTLGWAKFVNRDETNYVEIRMASGGSNDHVRVSPGKFALFEFGSDVTAPYIIANTASCVVDYLIFNR